MSVSFSSHVRLLCFLAAGLWCAGCARDYNAGRYGTPYQKPLVSPGAQMAATPPTVQRAIRAQTGAAQIQEIYKLRRGGDTVYVVTFRQEDILPPLYIAENGSILNPDFSVAVGAAESPGGASAGGAANLGFEDLPDPVLVTLRENAPGTTVETIHKETWGQRAIYVISFKDPQTNPKLYVLEDGTLLQQGPR